LITTMKRLILFFISCLLPSGLQAARIVSLMPSYTEIIFELGAGGELVGVSNFSDWPERAAGIKKVGDYFTPDIEGIYSLRPDIVFTCAGVNNKYLPGLKKLGIKTVELKQETSVSDIYVTVRAIAAGIGKEKEGEKLVKKLKSVLPARPDTASGRKVYIDIDDGGWTCGGRSFISDAVRLAGGVNVFSSVDKNYFKTSWEEILVRAPDYILILSEFGNVAGNTLSERLPAVKKGGVIRTIDRDAFTRPGPRLFDEIKKLNGILEK